VGSKKLPIVGAAEREVEQLVAGDSATVIAALRERVVADPDDEAAWLRLGAAYLHVEHWTEAADALARAVALDDTVLEARRLYARALGRSRRHDEAVFQLVQARRLAPDDVQVARELGVAFYDKRLFDKALVELERARSLDPSDARTHFAIGLAHEAKKDMAPAIAAFREAVALEPSFVEARRTLADALAAMGELRAAVRELEAALRLQRTSTEVATNLEVLRDALARLEGSRLLGRGEDALEKSALVHEGQLKRKGRIVTAGAPDTVRWAAPLCELWVTSIDGGMRTLVLVFLDPHAAAAAPGDAFQVTVVGRDGKSEAASFATAATLTFLREALGCTMTEASDLYARLLRDRVELAWADARIGFVEVDLGGTTHHGLAASL
jgi:tetratricopeptide (TPR) repeat protein